MVIQGHGKLLVVHLRGYLDGGHEFIVDHLNLAIKVTIIFAIQIRLLVRCQPLCFLYIALDVHIGLVRRWVDAMAPSVDPDELGIVYCGGHIRNNRLNLTI